MNACVRPSEGQIIAATPAAAARPDDNARSPAAPSLRLSVLHDLVCPWSRIGIHRLLRTLTRRADLTWSIGWEPFLLHPEMPRLGMDYAEYSRQKYGSPERARRMQHTVTTLGRTEGLTFRFDRIRRVPSTLPAHWLLAWAAGRLASPDRLAGLVLAVSGALFEQGADISLPSVLGEIAAAHGLDPDEARAVLLRTRDGADSVLARSRHNAELGLNGIPCLITSDGLALAGAQDEPALERMLDVALHWDSA